MTEIQRDIDLMGMPLEGVVAYWLSLKKLVGGSRSFKSLGQEAEFTPEPFVRHLLELAFASHLDTSRVRELAFTKGEVLADTLDRRFDLMRIAVMDVASGENPHRTLARMGARFLTLPVEADRALAYAQELLRLALEKEASEPFFNVHHRQNDDKLLVTLLFYVMLARHHGRIACRPFVPHMGARFFGDALALVVDGFDAPFVRKWMKRHKQVFLDELRGKVRVSVDLCLGIRDRLDYDDLFRVARSHMR